MSTKSPQDIQRIVDGLGYDFKHYEIEDFVRYIERLRKRRIMVRRWELQRDVSGMWLPIMNFEIVAYNTLHHPILQIHGILHEIGHMVLGHKTIPLSDVISPEILAEFDIDIPINGQARLSRKEHSFSAEDIEAERFAFAIQKRVLHHNRVTKLYRSGSTVPEFKPYADGDPLTSTRTKRCLSQFSPFSNRTFESQKTGSKSAH